MSFLIQSSHARVASAIANTRSSFAFSSLDSGAPMLPSSTTTMLISRSSAFDLISSSRLT
jgi:hypothetical protein